MIRELPQPRTDAWDLLKSVRVNDQPHLKTLLEPLGDTAAQARYFLLEGLDLQTRFLGVQVLANSLRGQGDMITSAEVAGALFRALEHDPTFVHGQQAERHMVNNVLDLLKFALSHSGRYRELILEYPRWLAVAERTQIDPSFASGLRLALVEALFHAGEYERAIGMLEEARSRGIESSQIIEAERLGWKLQDFYGRVDEVKPESLAATDIQRKMLDALGARMGAQGGEPAPEVRAAQVLVQKQAGTLAGGGSLTTLLGAAVTAQGLSTIERLEQLTSDLWSQRSPLPSLIQCMDLAGEVLTSGQGHDKVILRRLLANLTEIIAYSEALDQWDDCATAKWMQCIVLKRLEDFEASAVTHRDLRLNIEDRRTHIENPLMRGRLAGYFNYLYRSNAEVLFALNTGQEEEIFHVIESAKWKILTESTRAHPFVATRQDTCTDLAMLEGRTLNDLRQTLPAVGAEALYINYLADDDCTYAVTVAGDGQVSTKRIQLGAATLTEAALELQYVNDGDPRTFRSKINPRRPEESSYEPVIRTLSPLVDWLELDGTELLFVNLPHEISTVPVHMLQWRGKPLIDRVGVVHAPGAELLSAGARDAALYGPFENASVFSIPRAGPRSDVEATAFARVAATIEQRMPDRIILELSSIDRQLLAKSDLTHRLVHLSSHGHFDQNAPLKRSGIFIADRGELPSAKEQQRFLFTADDAAELQIAGSHITLSACVCGRSAQIAPGEALGMIWGLLRGRARAVLGACWNANREATTDLMVRFYELWLGGVPKWKALRQAICELKSDRRRSHPYFWAPFVLFGHWN